MIRFPRLLLTGAAGALGHVLRPGMRAYCDMLRISDRDDCGEAQPGEEVVAAALEDAAAAHWARTSSTPRSSTTT